jgi:antirestriction protein
MEIKGFITNLGKYNEGVMMGEWITFPIDEEELETVLERIGINEEYEEVFFTDWECEIDCGFGEYEDIESVNELAERLEEIEMHDDLEKLEAIIEATGDSLEEALNYMDDAIFYPGYTLEEVAEEIIEDCYGHRHVDEIFYRYFDYEAFARDLEFDGYTEVSGGVICTN